MLDLVVKILKYVPAFIKFAEDLFASKPKAGSEKAQWVANAILDGLNLAGLTAIAGVPLSAVSKLQKKVADAVVEFFNEVGEFQKS